MFNVTSNRVITIWSELLQSLWISRHHTSSHYLWQRKTRNQLFFVFPVKLCLLKGINWCSSKIFIELLVYKLILNYTEHFYLIFRRSLVCPGLFLWLRMQQKRDDLFKEGRFTDLPAWCRFFKGIPLDFSCSDTWIIPYFKVLLRCHKPWRCCDIY